MFMMMSQRKSRQWIYDEKFTPDSLYSPYPLISIESGTGIELPHPPKDILESLMNAARIGNVETIHEIIEKLMQQESFIPFADKIRRLVKSYRIADIREIVTAYLQSK